MRAVILNKILKRRKAIKLTLINKIADIIIFLVESRSKLALADFIMG